MRKILFVFALVISVAAASFADDWRQFRGNDLTGVTKGSPPTTWSETENVAWKSELEGRGLSGPIVVGDAVIVTASSGYRQDRLHVYSFNKDDGRKNWERQFWATGSTMCHPKMAVATPTPASDGERIFAFYSSNDLVCLDMDGNLLWYRGLMLDYPNARNSLGMASSPIVVGKTLIVQVESDDEAFATGIDVETGVARWNIERKQASNWTSPTIIKHGADDITVLLQSSAGIDAIVPDTGEVIWSYADGAATIPSSVVAGNTVYVPSNGLTALQPEFGRSEPKINWQDNRLSPGTPSPLVLGDNVYVVNRSGVMVCADRATGEIASRVRLTGPFTSSPVATPTHLYWTSEEGVCQVVEAGPDGKLVAENKLEETILATPAIAGDAIYLRSDKHLWKISK